MLWWEILPLNLPFSQENSLKTQSFWVNCHISVTSMKAILGWFPSRNMIKVREDSEVGIRFTQIFGHQNLSMFVSKNPHPSWSDRLQWDSSSPTFAFIIQYFGGKSFPCSNICIYKYIYSKYAVKPLSLPAPTPTTCPNIKNHCVLCDKMHMSMIMAFNLQRAA